MVKDNGSFFNKSYIVMTPVFGEVFLQPLHASKNIFVSTTEDGISPLFFLVKIYPKLAFKTIL